jgi:hypothetical protein
MALRVVFPGLGVTVFAVLLAQAAALAQDGAARYAGVQLEAAQSFLHRARAAAAREDRARAGRLAWQASIDARLALGMADSPHLRRDAAEVAREAAALIDDLRAPEGLSPP